MSTTNFNYPGGVFDPVKVDSRLAKYMKMDAVGPIFDWDALKAERDRQIAAGLYGRPGDFGVTTNILDFRADDSPIFAVSPKRLREKRNGKWYFIQYDEAMKIVDQGFEEEENPQ